MAGLKIFLDKLGSRDHFSGLAVNSIGSNAFYILTFRHYTTIRKVAGSIPDEVIGFFN
jgi:hypothetical protein